MENSEVTFEQVLALARQLSLPDQAKLIRDLARALEVELRTVKPSTPRPSLQGALADLGPAPSAEDIDEIRREMWVNFPRDDF